MIKILKIIDDGRIVELLEEHGRPEPGMANNQVRADVGTVL
jgi:hypothetical protein